MKKKSNQNFLYIRSFILMALLMGAVFFFFVHASSAAIDPIVQCGNDPAKIEDGCTVADLFSTAKRILDYMFAISGVIAVGGVVYGGFLMVTSGGSPDRLKQGKKSITYAMVGLAIVLLSVLTVQTVFSLIKYNGTVKPLNPSTIPQQSQGVQNSNSTTSTASNQNTSPVIKDVDVAPVNNPTNTTSGLFGLPVWTGQDPYPSLVWKSGDAGTDAKLSELNSAVSAFNAAWKKTQGGGSLSVRQAFRPQEYQIHLRGVWEANRISQGKSFQEGYGCDGYSHVDSNIIKNYSAEQKALLAAEVTKHQSNTDTPPACVSDHGKGFAVDITPPGKSSSSIYKKWMEVGESVGLCHYIAGDEPHFGLKKYLPAGTNCLQP